MNDAKRGNTANPFISDDPDVAGLVPRGLRIGAALAWRFLVVIAALYVIIWVVGYLYMGGPR